MTLIVNMVAGPGTGKSTTAAAAFAELKQSGVNAELVTEYAKDLVWGRTTATLDNQIYIFAKQYHRLFRLLDQVEVVVTDCPLFLSLYYGGHMSETFKALVLETWNTMDNVTFFLERVKQFNPKGRLQSEDKAKEIDQILYNLLLEHDVDFSDVRADRNAGSTVAELVLDELRRRKERVS